MFKFLSNHEIYDEVIIKEVFNAQKQLWIATADIKDMYVGSKGRMVPFLEILANLIEKGVSVRLIHAKEPGKNFREDFDRYPILFNELERLLCPRVHLKNIIIDNRICFIGSANLDPRSLKINTEMGLLVESKELNAHVREVIERDYALANSWHVRLDGEGGIIWVADHKTLTEQPADSFMQRIEDWFFAILPVEEEM